ncbi:hypothetical protein [Phocaeicola sp.]|uniref:hypothetical protein n=1 Tax=Phocaeicola sp. TaxID=2773926 RepID=UPI003A91FB20
MKAVYMIACVWCMTFFHVAAQDVDLKVLYNDRLHQVVCRVINYTPYEVVLQRSSEGKFSGSYLTMKSQDMYGRGCESYLDVLDEPFIVVSSGKCYECLVTLNPLEGESVESVSVSLLAIYFPAGKEAVSVRLTKHYPYLCVSVPSETPQVDFYLQVDKEAMKAKYRIVNHTKDVVYLDYFNCYCSGVYGESQKRLSFKKYPLNRLAMKLDPAMDYIYEIDLSQYEGVTELEALMTVAYYEVKEQLAIRRIMKKIAIPHEKK